MYEYWNSETVLDELPLLPENEGQAASNNDRTTAKYVDMCT